MLKKISLCSSTLGILIFVSAIHPVFSAGYSKEAMLHGAVVTTGVSGYKGTPFTLTAPSDKQAVYGLFSVERSDNPCYVAIQTESINDSSIDDGALKDLCGKKATSSEVGVGYNDTYVLGTRVFVSGIRVCMNNDQTRVKGFQIRGKRVEEDAKPVALDSVESTSGQAGGSDVSLSVITEPKDTRTNCNDWKGWVDCPSVGQIATGVVVHFEAGDTPRSPTGIALQCRFVSPIYVIQ